MKIKDIVNIVLFGILAFILEMAGGYLTMVTGALALYLGHSLASLLVGPIFFILCHKVHKRGTIFAYYLFMGLVFAVMGFWPMLLILLATAIIGELCVGAPQNYHNDKKLTFAFVIAQFVYAMHGFIFLLLLKKEGILRLFPDMFDEATANTMSEFFSKPTNVIILMIVQVIISYIGAKFGIYIYRKFFAKDTKQDAMLH